MAEKDIAEKALEEYNDVFADIINGIIFNGKQVVKPEDLEDAATFSHYMDEEHIREQNRDVSKYWKGKLFRIARLGIENQTNQDADMPLRVINYDGAAYRGQLTKENKSNPRYPVISLVLYFDHEKRWTKSRKLTECLVIPKEYRDDLNRFVSEYEINVIDIAWLSDEQIEYFHSDFRVIVDYFVQMRKNKNYKPSDDVIQHVQEMFALLTALTGDDWYKEAALIYQMSDEGGKIRMSDGFLTRIENRGIEKGIEQGEIRNLLKNICSVQATMNFSVDQAMDVLQVEPEKRENLKRLLKEFCLA